ncbi:MAG: fibronectin type III domain-containing protein [Candidatus Eisenbacteria bacterium]|nr:fibronectin type III domain-containing protein [Candidatus Eisenbacteria bacterium]
MRIGNRTLFTVITVLGAAAVLACPPEAAAETWNAVTLTWTAPGDDGSTGRATQYEVRYSTSAISGTDTTAWWSQATQCSGEPTPRTAGSTETFTVTGLEASRTYYFVMKTADEVPNWSGFSNVAVKTTSAIPDTIPPAAIRNLADCENPDFSLALIHARDILGHDLRGRVSPVSAWIVTEPGWPICVWKAREWSSTSWRTS